MRKNLLIMAVMIGLQILTVTSARAGEVDVLLDILVKKGILSTQEAAEVKTETEKYVSEELTKGASYAVPKWVQNIKLKGDLRTRYQYEKRESTASPRHRARIRARLGVVANINENIEAGVFPMDSRPAVWVEGRRR
jgi:hypothetical protein